MSADELMGESWIVRCSRALDTPLCTADFLNDEKYLDLQVYSGFKHSGDLCYRDALSLVSESLVL